MEAIENLIAHLADHGIDVQLDGGKLKARAARGALTEELSALIRYTAPFSFSGHPTLTVPAAFTTKGLPVAVQFVGQHLGEADICRAGRAFQRVTDFHRRHPKM